MTKPRAVGSHQNPRRDSGKPTTVNIRSIAVFDPFS
jgi:hypothetical protein